MLLAVGVAPACLSNPGDDTSTGGGGGSQPGQTLPPTGATSGSQGDTFDHDNDTISPWDLIQRIEEEGPPEFTSHMHSCPKVRYRTLGNVLADLGVNTTNTTQLSAGELYTDGFNALGGPSFANRIRENIGVTISGASREFDIFAAAAPEVIAALPTLPRCMSNGVGVELFDSNNQCRADGITCLLGQPASSTHIDICNLSVTSASSVDEGKNLAVAALLAAAYTCE
nr:hypothetical protein [Kofleriaceae bacterium]